MFFLTNCIQRTKLLSLIHWHLTLTQLHFNTGKTVTLRYNNTHTHPSCDNSSSPFLKALLITNYRCRVVFFRSNDLLEQICFLICRDKWLSFISPSLRPGLLAFGTPLGAAPGLVFRFHSERGNVTLGRCAFTWPSVNTCSESGSGGSTPRAQQGSPATRSRAEFSGFYLKRPFVRQHWACFQDPREGL